jgi:two-component system LytT family response regulator
MRTIIVDDERLARNELRRLLDVYPQIEIIDEATNGEEAITKINQLRPELVFLDIQMPGKSGFEVLEALDDSVAPDVIFTTAYDEYALKAFDFDAIDYLLKPIETNRLDQAIK